MAEAEERLKFQFTPARGGRPAQQRRDDYAIRVSIHARAWRATAAFICPHGVNVFQFTPARGGRPQSRRLRVAASGFNSRPRVAGDPLTALFPAPLRDVSIHARAWRATFVVLVVGGFVHGFNSRPRVAGDIR